MYTFILETLGPEQVRSVYPLIREAMPTSDLAAWLRFARPLTAARRSGQAGIVAARRIGRHFPCGLFCYRVDQDLKRGQVLMAENFVAVDLLDPDAVLGALLGELDSLARRLGCTAIRSVVHGEERYIAGGLSAAGHLPDGELRRKPVEACAMAHHP